MSEPQTTGPPAQRDDDAASTARPVTFRRGLVKTVALCFFGLQIVTAAVLMGTAWHAANQDASAGLTRMSATALRVIEAPSAEFVSLVERQAFEVSRQLAVGTASERLPGEERLRSIKRSLGAGAVVVLDDDGRIERAASAPGEDHLSAAVRTLDRGALVSEQDRFTGFMVSGSRYYRVAMVPLWGRDAAAPQHWLVAVRPVSLYTLETAMSVNSTAVALVTRAPDGRTAVATPLRAQDQARFERDVVDLVRDDGPRETQTFAIDGVPSLARKVELQSALGSAWLLVVASKSELFAGFRTQRNELIAALVLALLLGTLLARYVYRRVSEPLRQLLHAVEHSTPTEYREDRAVSRNDEFGVLARALRTMHERAASRERQIERAAYTDELTGLPRRRPTEQALQRLLDEGPVDSGDMPVMIAALYFGGLRELSHAFGYRYADRVFAQSLQHAASLLPEGTVFGRLGQFDVLIALGCSDEAAGIALLKSISRSLNASADSSVRPILRLNAGVAFAPRDGMRAAELIRFAEVAAARAAQQRVLIVEHDMKQCQSQEEMIALASDMEQALRAGEFFLDFQPKIRVADQHVVGVEALIRWRHPQRGLLAPSRFIEAAERTGQIRSITDWAISAALAQIRAWEERGVVLDVSVNVTAEDLADEGFPLRTLAQVERSGANPARLILEITESMAMRDVGRVSAVMSVLGMAGVRFSMDDFGTGYSSIAQLKRLAVDEIKIDRSLVHDLGRDSSDEFIVRAVVQLGRLLELTVVAEGVETAEQLDLLRQFGCDLAQGFLIARPMAPEALEEWILRRQPVAQGLGVHPSEPMRLTVVGV